jgi:hypothetical protein
MNALFEEFVAAFLRRHKDRIELGEGRRLTNIEPQRALGKLFGEFNMKVDLILTDTDGERFLVDTKYKVLDTSKQHDGLSQSDFYQMYAYGNAGRRRYDRVVLLYPATEPAVDRAFHQAGLALEVRQFDLRKICDPDTGRLDIDGARTRSGALLGRSPSARRCVGVARRPLARRHSRMKDDEREVRRETISGFIHPVP